MAIRCPHCGHGMTIKDAKPGKYKPKCSKCATRFALTVPDDATQSPLVAKLADSAATLASATQRTAVVAPTAATHEETMPASPVATMAPALATIDATVAPDESPVATAAVIEQTAMGQRTQAGNTDSTLAPQSGGVDETFAAAPRPAVRGSTEETAPGVARDATRLATPEASSRGGRVPEVLGGYKLVKELGRGAMGAVYLAKQLSLDRNVALKLIQAQWAQNPVFIARFTREAYAAAQLTHHNVVQIYDLGAQADINYFSMEFVNGKSLADLVEQKGKLDPEEAVGYLLQAARGLQFAHNHGMVHRDVKPANLMVNEHGIVKVADLGLVKTPQVADEPANGKPASGPVGSGSSLAAATADVTLANVAMGTPAYMAPEQAENAATVDHRADIYSLGCTLYVLLTGRPPFEGASALEVITKHRTEPIIRPEAIVKRIPPELSEIVLRMVAKQPEKRYQNLTEVIHALEDFMGIKSSVPFSPGEDEAQKLEESLDRFNNAPLVKLRGLIPPAFVAASAGLFVLLFVAGLASSFAWSLAGMVGALGIAASLGYFVIGGMANHTALFDRVRGYIFSWRLSDWLTAAGGLLVGVLVLWLLGWLFPALIGSVLGVGLGTAYYFVIDKQLARSRKESLDAAESLLRSLRLKGVGEAAIEHFVVKYSGDHWEEFFEALFGYEAKLRAREELTRTEHGRRKRQFGAWRDAIIQAIDARRRLEQEERARKHLRQVEEANLKAQGVDAAQARHQAIRMADALVDDAAQARENPASTPAGADPKVIAAAKRDRQLKMLADARSGAYESKRKRSAAAMVTGPLGFALGGKLRFLAGALLLAGCVLWMNQNGISGQVRQVATDEAITAENAQSVLGTLIDVVTAKRQTEPLSVPVVGIFFNSFAPGMAGLILLVLGLFRGWKMSLFAWPAAIVALAMPGLIGYGVAAAIAVVGLVFGRTAER